MSPDLAAHRWLLGRRPRRTLARIAGLVLASVVVFGWVLRPVRLSGPSMLPSLAGGHLSLVYTLAYHWTPPARGDIVAVRMAGPNVLLVKRIIGLPGDRLQIDAGRVLINGRELVEPYVRARQPWTLPEIQLGSDEYFLIGDNRGMPMRDHSLGRASSSRIVGRVVR